MSHRTAMIVALLAYYAVEVLRVTPEAAEELNPVVPPRPKPCLPQPKPRPPQGAKEEK